MKAENAEAPGSGWRTLPGRMVAVIDIGSSSIRMAVAHISPKGDVDLVDSLSQSIGIGVDSFEDHMISGETTRACIQILKSFRQQMLEYGISEPRQVRAVATSAVREASNRQAFLDRLYTSTGIEVEAIDEAETSRLMYFSVMPFMPQLNGSHDGAYTAVVEIGGGSTELLLLKDKDVVFSEVTRLGALRLRHLIETHGGSPRALRELIASHIDRVLDGILRHVPEKEAIRLVTLGGDMRFAVSRIQPDWTGDELARIPAVKLEKLAERILKAPVEELVSRYALTFAEAEALGIALLAYVTLAKALGRSTVKVSGISMRDGLLQEMAGQGTWTTDLVNQIEMSAFKLGRKYHFDEDHATQVAAVSEQLFALLEPEHQLSPRYRLLLKVAAIVHEIGLFISARSHHKHSMYLILNSEIFGLSKRMVELVALTVYFISFHLRYSSHNLIIY